RVRFRAPGITRHPRRMLPTHAVAYAALMAKLDLKLGAAHKKRLLDRLTHLRACLSRGRAVKSAEYAALFRPTLHACREQL
ncbi:MAG TPA: hypothetical protein VJ770_15550, partial [Stellaceae bacterium]|nr:hypothetical protein [Stellaceae bacterium]